MKLEVLVLVTRYVPTNQILEMFPLADVYTEVGLTFFHDMIGGKEDIEKAFAGSMSESWIAKQIDQYNSGEDLYFSYEAKDHVGIGNISVEIVSKFVEID